MELKKESINIVVVGHVDHGKSTLIGRLLYDTDSLPLGAIEKVKKLSKEKGKNFEYAFLLDAFEEEQQQGITIDTTSLHFSTEKRDYTIIDAPGHKEFLKNMISGAANAEVAFLIIDAKEGVREQSKRHGYIVSLLGIKKVYVIVNKMDLVDYSYERFKEIKEKFNAFLHNLSVYPINYIPISAYYGENLIKKSEKMSWYKGYSVLETMDQVDKEESSEKKPLRFPIQDVYKFDHRRIIVGKIESGTLKVGDKIVIAPTNKITKVKSIEGFRNDNTIQVAYAGDSVGITVEDEFFNKRGEIICHPNEVIKSSKKINANIFWLGKNDLIKGKKYKIKLTTMEIECEVESINKVIDASTLTLLSYDNVVKRNDVAEVIFNTKSEICYDEFSKLKNTGRFVIVDDLDVSGGGIIIESNSSVLNRNLPKQEKNIDFNKYLVTREDREKQLNQKGVVIWLTGMPGCGKKEIAQKLEKKLFDMGKKVYYLDYSNISFDPSSHVYLSEEEVIKETCKIAKVAKLFADSGTITIVTSVTRFKKAREKAKRIIGKDDYLEIFLDATIEVRKSRNLNGFYNNNNDIIYEKSNYPVVTLFIENKNFNAVEYSDEIIKILEQL